MDARKVIPAACSPIGDDLPYRKEISIMSNHVDSDASHVFQLLEQWRAASEDGDRDAAIQFERHDRRSSRTGR